MRIRPLAAQPPSCVSGTLSLGDIGRTLVLRVPGAAPGGPDGAGAIIVVRVIFLRSELRVLIHDVISLGGDLAQVLAASAPRPSPGGGAVAFELTEDSLPPQVVAAYGGNAKSLHADVCTALSAADSERWLGRPDFEGAGGKGGCATSRPGSCAHADRFWCASPAAGRVLMTPRRGEKRWDPQPAPLLFSLPRPGAAAAAGGGAWDSTLKLKVASLGVSLIDARPVEMMYARASGIAAYAALTGVSSDFELRIDKLQAREQARERCRSIESMCCRGCPPTS